MVNGTLRMRKEVDTAKTLLFIVIFKKVKKVNLACAWSANPTQARGTRRAVLLSDQIYEYYSWMQQVIYNGCFKPACHNTSSQILKDGSNSFGLANISCLLCYQVCSFCLEQNPVSFLIVLKL